MHAYEPMVLTPSCSRSCSLGPLCTCAVSVRADRLITVIDVCTKGHLQVWAWQGEDGRIPDGFEVLSLNEGREFKVWKERQFQKQKSLSIRLFVSTGLPAIRHPGVHRVHAYQCHRLSVEVRFSERERRRTSKFRIRGSLRAASGPRERGCLQRREVSAMDRVLEVSYCLNNPNDSASPLPPKPWTPFCNLRKT